jgi:hypothetical protein
VVAYLSCYKNAYLLSKFKLYSAHEVFLWKKGKGNEMKLEMKTARKGIKKKRINEKKIKSKNDIKQQK